MNYPQEMYDEVRAATGHYGMLNETIDRILSVFATVPKVTLEEAVQIRSEYYRRVGPEGIKTAQEIMQQVVNAVLAERGPVIATKAAGGMVSLEDALADFTLPEFTCLPSSPVATPLDWVNMAFQFRRSHLTKPEPTVTLVDAVEGRSLEVPARAVHKMEYPEAVTYTHDPWANKDVCNLCGVYVSDQAKHTAWHGRAVRLMDNDTFDLIEHYNLLRANTIKDKETVASQLAEQLKGHYASPCIGYPDCDGDLIGYEHSSKCIAARLAEKDGNHA